MAIERKCPTCQRWNKDEDYCVACGTLLSPTLIEKKREKQREKQRYRPPTAFDKFIQRWKNSRFWFLRILYQILYSVGVIFITIASFFAWLTAAPNG